MFEALLNDLSKTLDPKLIYDVIVPILILLVGFFAGGLVQISILKYLIKLYKKIGFEFGLVLTEAMNGLLRWFGLFLALLVDASYLNIDNQWSQYLKNTALIGMVLVATAWLSRVAIRLLKRKAENTEILQNITLVHTTLRIVIFSIGILIALQTVGISIGPILTALGVGGLAVALALQPTLSNLFSGLSVTLTGKFKNGDFVELENGDAGYIEDISWRNTTIRTLFNNHVIVPNNQFADGVVKSFSWPTDYFSIFVECGVAYESDLQQVEQIALDTAMESIGTLQVDYDKAPLVRFYEFGDSSINFRVNFRTNDPTHRIHLPHEYVKRLKANFDENGITIPFPIRTLYFAENQQFEANPNGPFTAEQLQARKPFGSTDAFSGD
ncbi:MAG: mechanosensitive ion channel family protein [Bacteroidota bacterium]